MKNDLDALLRHALTPTEEPSLWLNQRILNRAEKEGKMEKLNMRKKRRIPAIIVSLVFALGITSITAYASWKYLTAHQVTEKMQEFKLTEAFQSEDAIVVNETQSFGEYEVTLIGIVSGQELAEYPSVSNGHISLDKIYAVVAIYIGDGKVVYAKSAVGICISEAEHQEITDIRRVVE